jgi:putative transposase
MAEPTLQGGNPMSTHQLYFHIVWTTRDRLPMIDEATQQFLDEFFKKTAARHESQIIGLAILRTHVHMLVRTPARIDLPRLVQFFKGGSSYAASRQPGNVLGLRWAKEYSATTVSPRQLKEAIRYLELQGQHHPGEAINDRLKPALGKHCP